MKVLEKIVDKTDEGVMSLIGQRATFFCMNYIITGKVIGVNEVQVKLEDAAIVYETGPLNTKDWKDAQKLPSDWYVRLSAVESYGVLK